MTTLYGYARVSTVQQNLEIQLAAIEKAGVDPANIFKEKMSGANADRPQLKKVLAALKEGDVIVVHKLDRLGRSVSQVTSIVDQLIKEGKHLVVIDANIDTRLSEGIGGIMQKALITLLGLMAEMERTFILERTRAGIEVAKANNVQFGRKQVNKKQYEKAVTEYIEAEGTKTVPQILAAYDGLTEATFFRRLKAYKKEKGLI